MMQNIGQDHHSKTLFRCFLFSPPFKMHTVRQELPLIRWLIPEHFDCFNFKRVTGVLHSTTVLHSGDSIFNFKAWFSFLAGFSFYSQCDTFGTKQTIYRSKVFISEVDFFPRKNVILESFCSLIKRLVHRQLRYSCLENVFQIILKERISNNFKSG